MRRSNEAARLDDRAALSDGAQAELFDPSAYRADRIVAGGVAMKKSAVTMSGVRKASVSMGDDVTLSRFVKLPGERQPRGAQLPITGMEKEYTRRGISKFHRNGVKAISLVQNVLVSGHSNIKIGRDVRRGKLKGYWIYTLTLEERATCPSTCHHWITCYGNGMPFAKRLRHGPELLIAIEKQIRQLISTKGRRGILVRLHALGDFYSPEYVDFWGAMLGKYHRLAVFGYTARHVGTPIGDRVEALRVAHGHRFAVRYSDGGLAKGCTVSIVDPRDRPASTFICPEQTGNVQCCATCAVCWSTDKNVAFLEH